MSRLLLLAAITGCTAPDLGTSFTRMNVSVVPDEETAAESFVAVIESAEEELVVALPHATDQFLTDAIIAKHEEGVDVKVVSDLDQASDVGLQDLADAGVPLRLANPGISYFDFSINTDVAWDSDEVTMSHAFAIADRLRIVNSTAAGGTGGGQQVLFELTGEDLGEDFWIEFNQVFGGSDASALTAYSAPAKSTADVRWLYNTDTDVPVEMWLGPQERVTKRIIDAIYSARRSVRVMSNELVNDGLVRAMQEKASWGFATQVIVGPEFGTTSQALSRVLQNDADDVEKFRFDAELNLPTLVLIDIEGGEDVFPRAYVLSHDLYSASRIYRNGEVLTDQLIDGNLFVLSDKTYASGEKDTSHLAVLEDLWYDHLDRAGAF